MATRTHRAFSPQGVWEWPIALESVASGTGGGLFVVAVVAVALGWPTPPGAMAVVVAVAGSLCALAGVVLLLDLGRPDRAMNVFAQPGSPLSVGAVVITVFLAAVVGSLVRLAGLVPAPRSVVVATYVVGLVAAVAVMAYPGYLFAASRGVPAWNSALLTPLLVGSSLLGGAAGLVLIGAVLGWPVAAIVLQGWTGLVVVVALLLAAYVVRLRRSGPGGERARDEMVRGRISRLFWGAVLAHVVVPALATVAAVTLAPWWLAVGAGAALVGGFALRYLVLRADVPVPLRVGPTELDLAS